MVAMTKQPKRDTLLGRTVRQLRMERGLSQGALARKAGLGRANITMIESGRQVDIKMDTAERLARALQVDVGVLKGANRTERSLEDIVRELQETIARQTRTREDLMAVRIVGDAGAGDPVPGGRQGEVMLPRSMLEEILGKENVHDAFAVRIIGDRFATEGIHDSEYALARETRECLEDSLCVIRLTGNERAVRHVRRLNGGYELISNGDRLDGLVITLAQVEGEVVAVIPQPRPYGRFAKGRQDR